MNFKKIVLVTLSIVMVFVFVGCGDNEDVAEFNKPARECLTLF